MGTNTGSQFFVTGGPVSLDAPCYLPRQADVLLWEALQSHELCYILDARQVGKSSLVIRAANLLKDTHARVGFIQIDSVGQPTSPEQWYGGLLHNLASSLGLRPQIEECWISLSHLSPVQRWFECLREVAMSSSQPLYIFIDEIDATRRLAFSTDEFFAAIRESYIRRKHDPLWNQVTFCLAGATTPGELISDPHTTPFNIGQRIELADFTLKEAHPLLVGLEPFTKSPQEAHKVLERVLYWTSGHPYLTQRLCRSLTENKSCQSAQLTTARVDQVCRKAFLSREASQGDANLADVANRVLGLQEDAAAVLSLYAQILQGKPVRYDPADPRCDALRLSGIITLRQGRLQVRNRIYATVFDNKWAKENLPGAERRRQEQATRAGFIKATLIWGSVVLIGVLIFFLLRAVRAADSRASSALKAKNTAVKDNARLAKESQQERLARRTAEAKHQSVEKQVRELDGKLGGLRTQFSELESKRHSLEETLATARAGVKQQQGIAQATRRTIESMNGGQAAALSLRRGSEFDALTFGLRAVEPSLKQGREPDQQALQGLADAVNVGIVRRLRLPHPYKLSCACFSPDGRRILTAGRGQYAYLWDAQTGRLKQRIQVYQSSESLLVNNATFSADGKLILTVAEDNVVRLWDATSTDLIQKKPVREIPLGKVGSACAELSLDGRLLAYTIPGNSAQILDLASDKRINLEGKHSKIINSLAFSWGNDRLATGGSDGFIKVWDTTTGKLVNQMARFEPGISNHSFPNHPDWFGTFCVRFNHDVLLCAGGDPTAIAWIWSQGQVIHRYFPYQMDRVWSIDGSADHQLVVTGSQDHKARIYNLGETSQPLYTLDSHTGDVQEVRFAPDGRQVVTASTDGTAQVWTLTQPLYFNGGSTMNDAAFSPDGTRLGYLGGDGMIEVQERSIRKDLNYAQNPNLGYVFNDKKQLIGMISMAFSPSGKYVAISGAEGVVTIREGRPGRKYGPYRVHELKGHQGHVYSVRFSPDERQVMTAGADGTVRLWETSTGQEAKRLVSGKVPCFFANFSPDGKQVAVAQKDGAIGLYAISTGALEATLLPVGRHSSSTTKLYPLAVEFSPDGKLLASADRDGMVYLWDVSHHKLRATLAGHTAEVRSVAFSPDGTRLASASLDGTVRLWLVAQALDSPHLLTPLMIRGHAGGVRSARFSPDGETLATAGDDGTARVYSTSAAGYVKRARQLLALQPSQLREGLPLPSPYPPGYGWLWGRH
ncbi:AAA-like domain-containing protein [Armatimonas sp.]|uniref:WD40 domain-containing protein n=1 Tax=Armatimonas sp. TaxID=1872638 RepID=UPI003750F734